MVFESMDNLQIEKTNSALNNHHTELKSDSSHFFCTNPQQRRTL